MENVNKQRESLISPSELEYGTLEFNLRGVAYIWQSNKVGGTQIHFLSDVLVAVASLDLKDPCD